MGRPWVMRMRWLDLLFAHWPVDADSLRRLIPAGLEPDLFEGRAYVGAVPFRMENVSARGIPAIPWLHAFPELNLRTYVKAADGRAGVWFFSLDAGQKLAVRVARRFFYLPYFDARFAINCSEGVVDYSSVRTHHGADAAAFSARYSAAGPVYAAQPGSLDYWLTERYCLYSADRRGRIYRGAIEHRPWPLQPAWAEIRVNSLGKWLGIEMAGAPETLHFARSLDVRAWTIQKA